MRIRRAFRSDARKRGMAMITVMLLLTTVLSLSVAFMLRANTGFFTSRNTSSSVQAFYVASSGARFKADELEAQLRITNDVAAAITAMNNSDLDSSGNPREIALLDANNNTVGYYQVARIVADSPHLTDLSSAFSSPYSIPYQTITVTVTGSDRPAADKARATRTVSESYNVGMAPVDALNFAYVQNNWSWFSGFGDGQADVAGDSGSNGYYSILSGYVDIAGGTPLSTNGTVYNSAAYVAQRVNGDIRVNGTVTQSGSGLGTMDAAGSVSQSFSQLAFPKNLSNIADPSGPYITKAAALAAADPTTGKITVQRVLVTNTPTAANPTPVYTVLSSTDVVTGGVYNGSKENLVIGSLTATRGAGTAIVDSKNIAHFGDILTVTKITGMVVVKGNVAIQGYVTGRGSLYAGRNVYISGDVLYANPPSSYPSQSAPPTSLPTPTGVAGSNGAAATGDYLKDQVLFAAGKSVVEGDLTDKSGWWDNSVGPWMMYKDPIGEYVNDNHEDAGVDGVVSDLDAKEADGKWTVMLKNNTTGVQQLTDLTLANNAQGHLQAQVPSGWSVVPGTGEDTDSDGLYTPPVDYYRDFAFSSRTDSTGSWTNQAFSSTYFDNYPSGVSGYSDSSYQRPIHRIDGFLMANYAVAGITGGNDGNIVMFGGMASRSDGQLLKLSSNKFGLIQDARFSSDPNATANSFVGAPMAPRIVYVQWTEK